MAGEPASGKAAIRQAMLLQRSQLTARQQRDAADKLPASLASLFDTILPQRPVRLPDSRQICHIAAYAAIHGELDLRQCWTMLLALPGILYFPAVQGDRLLLGRLPEGLMPDDFLRPGVFGVPEPPAGSLADTLPPLDLMLIPGLAFDRMGNRLGWGKAYYDRLLSGIGPDAVRIGVCYDWQIVPGQLPSDAHDQRMNVLLTPEGWLNCQTCPGAQG